MSLSVKPKIEESMLLILKRVVDVVFFLCLFVCLERNGGRRE